MRSLAPVDDLKADPLEIGACIGREQKRTPCAERPGVGQQPLGDRPTDAFPARIRGDDNRTQQDGGTIDLQGAVTDRLQVAFEPEGLDSRRRNFIGWKTGLTRGQRLVVLVGQKKAIAIAVRNVSGRRRWSKLDERLRIGAPSRSANDRRQIEFIEGWLKRGENKPPATTGSSSPAWRYAALACDEPALSMALRYRSSREACSSRSSLCKEPWEGRSRSGSIGKIAPNAAEVEFETDFNSDAGWVRRPLAQGMSCIRRACASG